MEGIELNIEQFTNYFNAKMKSNLTLKQRLKSISEYFTEQKGVALRFTSKGEAYNYIINYISEKEDEAEDILDQLYYILEYTYSNQNPFFVYDLETNQEFNAFNESLCKIFKKEIRYNDFYYKRRKNISYDNIKKLIEIELDFREVRIDPIDGKEFTKDTGILKLTFDLINLKLISSNSTNSKSHNDLLKYLQSNGINIASIYILKRALFIKNRNFSEFSPTTLLMIILLYKTLPRMNYNFNLESISFSNLDSQNIQGVKMKGTDLLKAPEVLQRIHFGDDVHNVKLSIELVKIVEDEELYFNSSFIIEFRGKLSFIFFEDNMNEGTKRELSIQLQKSLMECIYAEDTINEGQEIIHKKLPKPKSFQQTVSELKNDLLLIVNDAADKIKIESYFSDKFPY